MKSRSKNWLNALLAGSLALASAAGFGACPGGTTKTWKSGGGANTSTYSRSQNWNPSGVPGGTDVVCIPTTPSSGTGFPVLDANGSMGSLFIDASASLTGASGFSLDVNGDITGTGTLNGSASAISVGGNMTVSTFTAGTSTVTFNGGGAQTIGGAYTFNNLAINKAGGTATLGGNTSVGGDLTFTAGTLSTSGSNFSLAVTGSITGTGTLTGNASAISVGGDMTVTSFTAGTSTVTFNGAGAQAIGGAYTFNNLSTSTGGTKTLGGNTTVNSVLTVGASTTLDLSSRTLNLAGNGTPLVISGTFTPSTSTVVYNSAGAQNIAATTYNNLQTATGGTKTLAGTTTVNSVLTVGASSTLDLSSRTLNLDGNGTPLVVTGTFTPSTSTVVYNSAGSQNIAATTYNNLQTATGGTKTLAGTTTINSVLTVGASSTLDLSSQTLNLAGNGTPLVISGTFTPSTSTVVYNSAGAQNIAATTYNNLQTATGGTKTLAGTTTVNSVLTVGASSTLDLSSRTLNLDGNGTPLVVTGTFTPSTSTVVYNSSGSQNIAATTYNNLQTATGGTKTLAGTTTVNSVLTVGASSTLDLSSRTLNLAGSGTPLVISGTFTASTSTVNYTSASPTTIAAADYNNLNGSGGNRTLPNGGTVGIAGNFTPGGGTYTVTGSTVSFNGAGAQATSGAFTFDSLTIAKSAGTMTLGGNATVNSTLTLSSGNISAGSNTVIITAGGTVSRTSGHVIGNLQKNVATGATSRTFEVGDASGYAPVTIAFGNVTAAGNLTVKATSGAHPDLANSGLDPTQSPTKQSVNRYWTATNSGVAFNNYSATLGYVAGDLDAGLDLTTVGIAKADSCTPPCAWTFPTMVGNATATSAQVSGLTGFSDFGVGHRVDHFDVSAPATATQGVAFSVTITAKDKNNNTVTGFTGTATITSTNGNCTLSAGSPTGNFTSGVYTGNVTISNLCSDTLTATLATNPGVTGTSGVSVTVSAAVSSFNAFETSTAANATTGPIYTKLFGTAFSLDVVALTSAPSQAAGFNDNVEVTLLANNTPGASYGSDNCPTSSSPIQTIASTGISGGRSTVNFAAIASAYGDVRVRVRYPTSSPTVTACSTDSFSVRPNATFSITSTNATNTAASGGPTFKTGDSFNLTAALSTVGYNGTPTIDQTKIVGTPNAGSIGGAFGAANPATGTATGSAFTYSEVGNFGLQANAVRDLIFTALDSAGGDCTLDFSTSLVGGKYGCYIGSAAVAQTTGSSGFGRFIPDNFDVSKNTPTLTASCGAFSYVGQVFVFGTAPTITVTARNGAALGNAVTKNYAGAYVKLANSTLTPGSQAARYSRFDALGGGGTPALGMTSGFPDTTTDPAIGAFVDGVGTLTFSSGASGPPPEGFAFTRSLTTPSAPFEADIALQINVIDGDNVAYASNPVTFGTASAGNGISITGGKTMRFGRLRILPATGLASLPLDVSLRAEYWNGTGFVTNTADSCTQIERANVKQSAYQAPLAACNTIISTTPVMLSSGTGTLRLSAPSGGNAGSVTLTPQLGTTAGTFCNAVGGGTAATSSAGISYLQGKWNNSANYDQDPSARAAFGVYGSQPKRFIFFRENY